MASKPRAWLLRIGVSLGAFALFFVLIEGLSSSVLFLRDGATATVHNLRYYSNAEERKHIAFDEELGWVGMPDRSIEDLYGTGKWLRTNSRGFRNEQEIEPRVPEGRVRVLCSGDSFTFGQGVANDKTWCHLLGAHDPTVEPVNIGQRGYGIDQAYLWYARDTADLDHQVHLFAFIRGDFDRMGRSRHHGYGKPVLSVDDGEIAVGNVPVSEFRTWRPWMSRLGKAAAGLRTVELVQRLTGRTPIDTSGAPERGDPVRLREVARAVFREALESNREKGSALVLVWLPTLAEIDKPETFWRPFVETVSEEEGIPFVDLTEVFRRIPPERAREMFIAEDDTTYVDAARHYNEVGHAWAAEAIRAALLEIPEVATRLVVTEPTD